MISIGLTGSIAGGKSQVGRILAGLGAHVVDADRIAHEAYAPGSEGFEALVEAFGRRIIGSDGAVDRRRLGELVFGDPEQLARLTAIVWPLTRRLVEAMQGSEAEQGTRVFVVETPLLYDAGWEDLFDEVWLVRSKPETALQRLQGRGLSRSEAEARLAAATSIEVAAARAHVVIDNDGSLEELEGRVEREWRRLTEEP
jgi:dephospho-CoA kinase